MLCRVVAGMRSKRTSSLVSTMASRDSGRRRPTGARSHTRAPALTRGGAASVRNIEFSSPNEPAAFRSSESDRIICPARAAMCLMSARVRLSVCCVAGIRHEAQRQPLVSLPTDPRARWNVPIVARPTNTDDDDLLPASSASGSSASSSEGDARARPSSRVFAPPGCAQIHPLCC